MKRFAMSVALLCALSVSALAVDVPTVGAPSPGQTQGGEPVDPGNIPTGGFTVPGEMPGVGLSALLTILALAFRVRQRVSRWLGELPLGQFSGSVFSRQMQKSLYRLFVQTSEFLCNLAFLCKACPLNTSYTDVYLVTTPTLVVIPSKTQ